MKQSEVEALKAQQLDDQVKSNKMLFENMSYEIQQLQVEADSARNQTTLLKSKMLFLKRQKQRLNKQIQKHTTAAIKASQKARITKECEQNVYKRVETMMATINAEIVSKTISTTMNVLNGESDTSMLLEKNVAVGSKTSSSLYKHAQEMAKGQIATINIPKRKDINIPKRKDMSEQCLHTVTEFDCIANGMNSGEDGDGGDRKMKAARTITGTQTKALIKETAMAVIVNDMRSNVNTNDNYKIFEEATVNFVNTTSELITTVKALVSRYAADAGTAASAALPLQDLEKVDVVVKDMSPESLLQIQHEKMLAMEGVTDLSVINASTMKLLKETDEVNRKVTIEKSIMCGHSSIKETTILKATQAPNTGLVNATTKDDSSKVLVGESMALEQSVNALSLLPRLKSTKETGAVMVEVTLPFGGDEYVKKLFVEPPVTAQLLQDIIHWDSKNKTALMSKVINMIRKKSLQIMIFIDSGKWFVESKTHQDQWCIDCYCCLYESSAITLSHNDNITTWDAARFLFKSEDWLLGTYVKRMSDGHIIFQNNAKGKQLAKVIMILHIWLHLPYCQLRGTLLWKPAQLLDYEPIAEDTIKEINTTSGLIIGFPYHNEIIMVRYCCGRGTHYLIYNPKRDGSLSSSKWNMLDERVVV